MSDFNLPKSVRMFDSIMHLYDNEIITNEDFNKIMDRFKAYVYRKHNELVEVNDYDED